MAQDDPDALRRRPSSGRHTLTPPPVDAGWAARERPNTTLWALRDRIAPRWYALTRRLRHRGRPRTLADVQSPRRRFPLPLGAAPAGGALDPRVPGTRRPPFLGERRRGPLALVAALPERHRVGLGAALITVVAVLLAGFVVVRGDAGDPTEPAASTNRVILPRPSPAVTVLPAVPSSAPAPSPSSAAPTSPAPTKTSGSPVSRRSSSPAAPPPARPSSAAPVVDLVAGSDVGLELRSRPGLRLRHRDYVAHLDPIGPASSALDRADSSFRVRAGMASTSCVSLESLNYPGFFLRHSDFVLRLDRRDGSAGFDADATFCTSPTAGGAAFVLGSLNYPDRYLVARRGVIRLDRVGPDRATVFAAARPLM